MDSGTGDRGVSEVMGFILVFGMLVIAFTVYQGIVVPDQNRQVEFQHNQEVQGQLQDLRNAIVSTASTGSGQAVSVTLGATYPKRTIAQNLGVSGGSIQTASADVIRLSNARALDGETRDYLDGSGRTFGTKPIRYTPVYSFYSGAPETVYENTLAYNRFDEANLTLTDQLVVDGRRITLIAVNGSLSKAQRETVSISTEAISASSNRVAVTNTTGERLNVTIPTRLSATKWEEILADEMDGSGYVEDVSDVAGADAVNITMQGGVTYEVRLAEVGVGSATADEGPEYVTAIEGDDTSVAEGGTQKLVVEVRDRFNNPVSNVTVRNETLTEGSIEPTSATTDSGGRVAFVYSAPANVNGAQDVDVNVTFDDGSDATERVTFNVRVLDADGSGGGGAGGGNIGNINPNDDDAVVLVEEVFDDGGMDCDNNVDCRVTITLDNKGSETRTIEEIRYNFYSVDTRDNSPTAPPKYIQINDETIELRGAFTDVGSPQLPPGESTLSMCFFTSSSITTSNSFDVKFGDFYILSVRFDDNSQATYFIPPVSGTPTAVDYDCSAGTGGTSSPYHPSRFTDGHGGQETDEDSTIPPSNSEGDLQDFANLDVDSNDNQVGILKENYDGNINGFSMNIGVAVDGIQPSSTYTLTLGDYRIQGDPITVTPVYANGSAIGSSYTLSQTSTTTQSVSLSAEASNYVGQTGSLYLVFEDTNTNTDDRLRIDYIEVTD